MKHFLDYGFSDGFRRHMSYVEVLMQTASDGPLADLENAIYVARLQRMARRLTAAGFTVMHSRRVADEEIQFNLILVYDPAGTRPGEWATIEECRRLLDTVANLSPAQAFARWRTKVQPLEAEEYTQADAVRDTLAARAALRQRAAETHMSAQDYALEYGLTSFMDLAKHK